MSQTFFEVEEAGGRDRERPPPRGRRPRVADRALVERERVVSGFLDAADASLVLLAAPAGYGKTTALAQWAEVDERPFAWIMLDGRYDDARHEVNATFFQPFLSKRIGPGRTVSTSFESTYDWERSQWTAPLNVGISQVLPVGRQMVSLQAGGAWYVEAPAGSPDWSLRLTVTLLYKRN